MTSFEKNTFLVVDDEAFSRSMVAQMLKRAGAAEIIAVENGWDAIEALNRNPITVMITDFHMPGIHGLQLLKNVRTGQTNAPRNLTCAMLTGHAIRHLVGLAIVLDVDAFLAKPVSIETLTKHLNRSFQYRFEPMPVETYDRVDVAQANQFLTGAKPAAPPTPAPTSEEGLPVDDDDDLDRTVQENAAPERPRERAEPTPVRPGTSAPTDDGSAPRAQPSKTADKKDAVRVALSEVPENAVLARNIIGSSGTLLLAAGTPFRSRYVRRLHELRDMEGEIEYIWIKPI